MACAAVCAGGVLLAQGASVRRFDDEPAGQPPAALLLSAFRQNGPGAWVVRRDGTEHVLSHAAQPDGRGWSLAVADEPTLDDVVVSARVRLAGGSRTAGLIWGYEGADTFHAVVLDLQRQETAAYRVIRGNRIRFDLEDDLELDAEAWHTMKVVQHNGDVTIFLGGIRVLKDGGGRRDRGRRGRAGVLAAGDADVSFDDLRIVSERGERTRASGAGRRSGAPASERAGGPAGPKLPGSED
jgi:hypothetical protein